jgi:hypothetical protein
MGTLTANVSFATPPSLGASVTFALTGSNCTLGVCPHSRMVLGQVAAGAASTRVIIQNVHAGAYTVTVLVNGQSVLSQPLSMSESGDMAVDAKAGY